MALSQQDYFLRPNESIQQYQARIGNQGYAPTQQQLVQQGGVASRYTQGVQPPQSAQPTQPVAPQVPKNTITLPPAPTKIDPGLFTSGGVNLADIQKLYEKNNALIQERQAQLQSALVPSAEQQVLQKELITLQNQAAERQLGFQKNINAEGDRTIPMGFIRGRQQSIAQNAALDKQVYAQQEQNLVQRLGLAQELQNRQIDIAKIGLEGALQDRDFAFKLDQSIQQQNQNALEMAFRYDQAQRQGLAQFIEQALSLGVDPSTIDDASITRIAYGLGIDAQTVKATMQAASDRARFDIAIKSRALEKPASGVSSGLLEAVLNNPSLFNQLTPTQKAALAPSLDKLGFTDFGKPLSDTAVQEMKQLETGISGLNDLRKKIEDNIQYIGPISGFQALNPFSEARKVQADIDRIRQQVGKALEGGVLRKEDEEKYKKILATLNDKPSTALYKIDALIGDLTRQLDSYQQKQKQSGRNIPGDSKTLTPDEARKKFNY